MERTTKETWAKHVERWKESGLSAAQFASEIGVNHHTLMHWKWRLGREARGLATTPEPRRRSPNTTAAPSTTSVSFVEVTSQPQSASTTPRIEIAIDGRLVVRVADGFDAETLGRVLDVLERRR